MSRMMRLGSQHNILRAHKQLIIQSENMNLKMQLQEFDRDSNYVFHA